MNLIILKNFIKNYLRNTKFYAIFLLKPLKKEYIDKKDYTSSHFNKGEDYHIKFENLPGRKIMWDLEKKIIDEFINDKKIYNHLDFASGTGRIAKFLEKKKQTTILIRLIKKNVGLC